MQRINKFLCNQELDQNSISEEKASESVISIHNGTFSWDKDMKPILQGFVHCMALISHIINIFILTNEKSM